jgi:5-methylcytosine-specific restriction protein A
MLDLITEASEIRNAQQRLARKLISAASDSVACRVGYQGGDMPIKAHWIEHPGIWFAAKLSRDEPVPRYWNGFGVERPTPGGRLNIACEINPPIKGVARQVEGAFARSSDGRVYLLHRGGIGGGRQGIGQALFFTYFHGERVRVRDADRESELALVADLQSPRLPRQIAIFVNDVNQFKRQATKREPNLRSKLQYAEHPLPR